MVLLIWRLITASELTLDLPDWDRCRIFQVRGGLGPEHPGLHHRIESNFSPKYQWNSSDCLRTRLWILAWGTIVVCSLNKQQNTLYGTNVFCNSYLRFFLIARFSLQRPYLSIRAGCVIVIVEVEQEQDFPTISRFLPVS